MSITVANLMAQVGADLTQFRLGMNEVDARLNQVKVRSEAGMRSVAAMRAESARLASVAGKVSTDRMATQAAVAAGASVAALTRQKVSAANAALAQAEADLKAAQTKGRASSISAADAELSKRKLLALEAKKEYEDAEREVNKLTAAVQRLMTVEDRVRRRSAGLATGADTNDTLNAASAAVATAYAKRLQQNSNEHRIRSLNTISGLAVTGGAVGLAGLGAATIAGGDFNQMLVQTAHNTQLSASGVKVMNDTVKDLGETNGGDFKEIANGFRILTDYGNSATTSQHMLKAAMEASVATGSDLTTTTELLAKATKEFNLPADQAGRTMAIMVEAGRHSSLTMEQMVSATSQLYATAANLGVSFVDVNAAMVTFTKHGLNASQMATQLRNDIAKITQPSKSVKDYIGGLYKKSGINLAPDFTLEGLRARQLLGVFQDIEKVANKIGARPTNIAAKLFPNLRGTIGAQIASGTGAYDLMHDRAMIARAAGGSTDPLAGAYKESLGQLNVQLARLKNISIVIASDISAVLAPSLINLFNKVQGGLHTFTSLGDASKSMWIKMAVGVSTGLLVAGTIGKLIVGVAALNTALLTMTNVGLAGTILKFGPWVLAIAAAIGAVVGLIAIYNRFKDASAGNNTDLAANSAAEMKAAQASINHAKGIVQLVDRYNKLRAVSEPTRSQLQQMHDILSKIAQLSPDLVQGFDKQHHALGLIAGAAAQATNNLRQLIQAFSGSSDAMDAASYRKKAADELAGYENRIKVQRLGGLTIFGHKIELPQDKTTTLGAAYQSDLKERFDRYKYDMQMAKELTAHIKDPYGIHAIKTVIPADPSVLPDKPKKEKAPKKSKEETEWERRVKAAMSYLDELRKKQYDVTHTGEIAANEWEIMSGKLEGMGKHVANVSREIVRNTVALELNKKMADAWADNKLIGHDDIKAGIEFAGGRDKWNILTPRQKQAAVNVASQTKGAEMLYNAAEEMKKRALQNTEPFHTVTSEAQATIQEQRDKYHGNDYDPNFIKWRRSLLDSANKVDTHDVDIYSIDQKRQYSNKQGDLKASLMGDIGQEKNEFSKWFADNVNLIQKMRLVEGEATSNGFIKQMRVYINSTHELEKQVAAQQKIDGLMEAELAKSNALKLNNPFDSWLETLKVYDKDKKQFVLPTMPDGKPMNLSLARQMYDVQAQNTFKDKSQQMLTDLNMQAIALREKDPFKVWAQSYMIFDQSLNNGRGKYVMPGGDENTRSANQQMLRKIYDYQTKIDLMKKAAEGLTGVIFNAIDQGYGRGFKGMFEHIKEGFKKMLFDMAVQFLQSRLLALLQSKLFGATGVGGGGGKLGGAGGFLGGLLGIAGSIFGGGSGKAGGISSTVNGMSAIQFAIPNTSFNTPHRALGGPVRAGQGYIIGESGIEYFKPDVAGRIYNSTDTSHMGSNAGNTHVYNINIQTPDAGSFHRTSGKVLDDMHVAAMRANYRNR